MHVLLMYLIKLITPGTEVPVSTGMVKLSYHIIVHTSLFSMYIIFQCIRHDKVLIMTPKDIVLQYRSKIITLAPTIIFKITRKYWLF